MFTARNQILISAGHAALMSRHRPDTVYVDTHCGDARVSEEMKKAATEFHPTVRFSYEEEFLNELRDRPPNIDLTVRATVGYDQSGSLPLQNVSVIATYLRDLHGLVSRVKLQRFFGQIYSLHETEQCKKVIDKAQLLIQKITDEAKAKGLECRAGIYE
jgi:hypothetical protein